MHSDGRAARVSVRCGPVFISVCVFVCVCVCVYVCVCVEDLVTVNLNMFLTLSRYILPEMYLYIMYI